MVFWAPVSKGLIDLLLAGLYRVVALPRRLVRHGPNRQAMD
jgi:hypothetical protein